MTTTKLLYFIGTVMPCGIVLLAALALYKAMHRRRGGAWGQTRGV